jgi:hypothetical protein
MNDRVRELGSDRPPLLPSSQLGFSRLYEDNDLSSAASFRLPEKSKV